MLLPNMTHDEIRKLLFLEFEEIRKRNEQNFSKLRRDVIKKKLKKKRAVFFKMLTSKNKTTWLVRIEKYAGDKYAVTSFYGAFFRDTKGFRFIEICPGDQSIEIYNAHLFSRYQERMMGEANPFINFEQFLKLVTTFFRKNSSVCTTLRDEEIEPGVFKVSAQLPEGIKLGIQDNNRNASVWNTFVSANEYKGNQKQLKAWILDMEANGEFELPPELSSDRSIQTHFDLLRQTSS